MKTATFPGKVKVVTSLANPHVKEIRALALKKNRDASRRFIAEGLKLVTDALARNWTIHVMVYARAAAGEKHIQDTAARARARGATILEVPDRVLAAISRRDNPQTVLGVFEQRWIDESALAPDNEAFWIALDRVRDPGNLGTVIRTADAVGATGVILVGETTDPFAMDAVRATMGSIFHTPLCRMSCAEFIRWRAGWTGLVIGTHLEGAVDYREPDYRGRAIVLIMGNEQQGLPEDLARLCDKLCLIPMAGEADSLNLAVATGVMAFEIRGHRLKLRPQKASRS